ncbi:pseudouridine synthase [Pedobacter xixiisoli]|uniref:Pseudouridine synthase n=1 Tax=Pedobacter xixiisoli TaxID=1476464 RepID=A0A286A852_9SPHI|nr:pseudouridine synthase [Pedobacter xixiisoli]SOD18072.1 23S rRNA pseudouridine2605 synthase [Pedobacter xixiisoli]
MTNSNKGKSRDDKSKPGRSTTGRRTAQTDSDKPRFSAKDENKSRSFGTNDRRDSKYNKSDDAKPRSSRSRNDSDETSGFKKSFDKRDNKGSYSKGGDFQSRSERPRRDSNETSGFKKSFDKRDNKPWEKSDKPFAGRGKRDENSSDRRDSKPWEKQDRPFSAKGNGSREENSGERRSYVKKDSYAKDGAASKFSDRKDSGNRYGDNRPFRKREDGNFKNKKEDKGERVAPTLRSRKNAPKEDDDLIRLNRYIANSGICSRRKADELIEAGVVSVNGVPVTELGHKVNPYKDEVRYNGELLKREKRVYVLLNKPKDYITTTEDPQERKTVMHLVEKASRERIYPVGRLDRNTTGLLLMTNDGDLADKLSHPRHGITKIYQVELNKNLSQGDFNKIQFGLELEDGLIKPDNISYVAGAAKNEVGIQIHSGKNRIVRRIFEHLGYDVVKLDRVVYGNLTKKDLPRGKWRFLDEHEIIQIKHLIK